MGLVVSDSIRSTAHSPIPRVAPLLKSWMDADAFAPRACGAAAAAYAELVEPVAKGVLALAQADGRRVLDITSMSSKIRSRTAGVLGADIRNARAKFLVVNSPTPEGHGMWDMGAAAWASGGKFGLTSLTLEVGRDRVAFQAELTLALSVWSKSAEPQRLEEFALLHFATTGHSESRRVRGVVSGEGFEASINPELALMHALGIRATEGFRLETIGDNEGIDRCLGFPYAEEVLLGKLLLLSDHLVSRAHAIERSRAAGE